MRPAAFRSELEKLLADDVPHGDLTTDALGIGALEGEMVFTARDPMVLAEAESAAALLDMSGCHVSLPARSGDALRLRDRQFWSPREPRPRCIADGRLHRR